MSEAPLLRMRSLEVEGLFGLYHHRIDFKLEDRVTILHGPNGVGKTVLLRLIANLFAGRLVEVARVPFDRACIEFTDGTRLRLESQKTAQGRRSSRKLTLMEEALGKSVQQERFEVEYSAHVRDYPQRSSPLGPAPVPVLPPIVTVPTWFSHLRRSLRVHLVETQRLFCNPQKESGLDPRRRIIPAVREDARHFAERIKEALAIYARESQMLDQSLPQRLIKKAGGSLPLEDLKRRMAELDARRSQLQHIGLLDESTTPPFDVDTLDQLDHAQRGVLTLYVEDTAHKLGVLDDLARRVELLLNIINTKFRHKKLRVDQDNGFVAIGHDGAPLEPDELSSGEQHELVLLYGLLFRVEPNTLVLIDEPELSLHLLWQKRFLPDLLDIVSTANFDALVATHSPFIVGDRSDLMVPLDAEAP